MRYEELHGCTVPKVGFGTWSIGGRSEPDHSRDAASLAALRSAIEIGYTHFDTAESYADGHCEELLGRVIRESRVDRGRLFLTSKISPENLAADKVLRSCEGSLRRLGTEYLDLYLIHWPNPEVELSETFKSLNRLLQNGKIKHLGVSNFDLGLLIRARSLSEMPILTNQVPMSVVERSYVNNGVREYCQANEILVTAYSPLKRRWPHFERALAEVAMARSLTVHQIAIAWLCSQPRVVTIPMSSDPKHQRDNLEAADVVLSASEKQLID